MTKKLTRSDVEELAAYAAQKTYAGYCPPTLPIPPGTLAELCRTWLAVDGADAGEIAYLCTDDAGAECHVYRRERFPSDLLGQRVKLVLVPEADSGGEG